MATTLRLLLDIVLAFLAPPARLVAENRPVAPPDRASVCFRELRARIAVTVPELGALAGMEDGGEFTIAGRVLHARSSLLSL